VPDGVTIVPALPSRMYGVLETSDGRGTSRHLDEAAHGTHLGTQGRTQVVAETRRLENVNTCFEEVLAGPARLVFDLAPCPLTGHAESRMARRGQTLP
jgi:propanol-preferring alcohol dehydrogenase